MINGEGKYSNIRLAPCEYSRQFVSPLPTTRELQGCRPSREGRGRTPVALIDRI
jgi:hypothetical protein